MTKLNKIAAALVASTAVLVTGCPPKIVPDREAPRKTYLSARPEELLASLAERNRSVKGLQARGKIAYRFTYSRRNYRDADIRFLFVKPDRVYVRGSARLVGTLFVLRSDGKRFWAEIPSEKKVYTGTVGATPRLEGKQEIWQGLNPDVLAEALLLDDIGQYRIVCATFPDRYIIDLLEEEGDGGLALRRQIEIEREHLRVVRHQVFGTAGEVVTDAYLYRYKNIDGIELPTLFRIDRHWEELSLRLELEDITLNPEGDEELFRYLVPSGFQVEDLDERKEVAEPS
jgi:outer membrane lipoprotein-sorting protein